MDDRRGGRVGERRPDADATGGGRAGGRGRGGVAPGPFRNGVRDVIFKQKKCCVRRFVRARASVRQCHTKLKTEVSSVQLQLKFYVQARPNVSEPMRKV